jgi:hypothetical protein
VVVVLPPRSATDTIVAIGVLAFRQETASSHSRRFLGPMDYGGGDEDGEVVVVKLCAISDSDPVCMEEDKHDGG